MLSRLSCLLAGFAMAGLIGFFLSAPARAQVAPPGTAVVLPNPLSLDQAVGIALRQQPTRYAALAQVNSSKGQKQEAVAQYFPSIIPTYSYQNKSTAAFGVQATPVPTQGGGTFTPQVNEVNIIRGGGLSVAIDESIYNGGQTEQANAEARHNLDAAELGMENTRQGIIETVTQDFYDLLADEDLETVAKASVAEFQSTVDQTQAEIKAGTTAKNDIYQAQANLANAQVTLMEAQITTQTASATLKNAMGVESDATAQPLPLAATGDLPPLPTAPATASLDDLIKQAYEYRPDFLQQQAQTQSSLAALRLARQQAGLNVSADYQVSYQATNDLGDRGVDTSLLVTGTYPLFDAGSARGAVRVAQGSYDSSRNQLDSVRQSVRLDVEVAYNQRAQFLQSAQLAQSAVQAAKVNYDSAVAGRAAGVGTILDIITAEQTLTQAQDQYVSAIYNYYIADSQLQKAIGRNETPATMSIQ